MYFQDKKILITGGTGFLGTAVAHKFEQEILLGHQGEYKRLISAGKKDGDLMKFDETLKLIVGNDIVIHLAADCGGIGYNQKHPGQLFYNNMQIGLNVIEACRQTNVEKVVIVGTICAYPKFTKVPFKEEELWNGYPEETNAPYGLAKRELLTMAQAYRKEYGMTIIYLLMVNLYGPGDKFGDKSHVIPAMIEKFYEAKLNDLEYVELWGTGKSTREFLYVDDAAEAIWLASRYFTGPDPVNVGTGEEISILNLAELIKEIIQYKGEIRWDISKPDGQPRRCLDVNFAKVAFCFKAKTPLREGLFRTIEWYYANARTLRRNNNNINMEK